MGTLDVIRRLIVSAEEADIRIRILEAHGFVGEVPQGLVVLHGPGNFLAYIGRNQLRTPIAVIAADQGTVGDVVQEARQYYRFALPCIQSLLRALQQMAER